jgi:hypothetical protein
MPKRTGMYSSNKRKKELQRNKKQEEKRLRRQKNLKSPSQDSGSTDSINIEAEPTGDAPEAE